MSSWIRIALALAAGVPAVALRLAGVHLAPGLAIPVFGGSVVGAAFLLVWAAEAARVDISGALATALLAVIAVLPEYAVDLYFAFTAGHVPATAHYATANMTGSNRLLLGLGWPFVAFVFTFGLWRRGEKRRPVQLAQGRRLELRFLIVASLYCVLIPLTRRIAWYDAVVLLGLFGAYLWRSAQGSCEEPELLGAARALGGLQRRKRRFAVTLLFLAAAGFVVAASEPFAQALVAGGKGLGIDEFLLVQWLAPLASESPELLVAAMLALRAHDDDALGTLLSSKVNQWTLLVGSLPLAFLAGGGRAAGIPLDARQTEEFVLTAAQTLLGLAVLIDLRFALWEAGSLLLLFALQFFFTDPHDRLLFSALYVVVAVAVLVRRRAHVRALLTGRRPAEEDPAESISRRRNAS